MGLNKIAEMRKTRGWTIDELSDRSGVPVSTIKKISAGITKRPNIETVKAIVHAMGFTLDDLDDESVLEEKRCPLPTRLCRKKTSLRMPPIFMKLLRNLLLKTILIKNVLKRPLGYLRYYSLMIDRIIFAISLPLPEQPCFAIFSASFM